MQTKSTNRCLLIAVVMVITENENKVIGEDIEECYQLHNSAVVIEITKNVPQKFFF